MYSFILPVDLAMRMFSAIMYSSSILNSCRFSAIVDEPTQSRCEALFSLFLSRTGDFRDSHSKRYSAIHLNLRIMPFKRLSLPKSCRLETEWISNHKINHLRVFRVKCRRNESILPDCRPWRTSVVCFAQLMGHVIWKIGLDCEALNLRTNVNTHCRHKEVQ
jgi:hypothetical protein